MPAALPPLVNALLNPGRLPHRVYPVETHGAWVLLADEFAAKIMKPVRFTFMAFHTLVMCQRACEAEIRVNRRFELHDHPATPICLSPPG